MSKKTTEDLRIDAALKKRGLLLTHGRSKFIPSERKIRTRLEIYRKETPEDERF
jgi:hypothetical protein